MNAVYEKLQICYESMQEKTDFKPLIAIVLGSVSESHMETEIQKNFVHTLQNTCFFL